MTAALLLFAAQTPFDRSGVAAVRVGAAAYVVGGLGLRQEPANTLLSYDLNGKAWHNLAYLPEPVYFPACVAVAGKVLVFGGMHQGGEACNHVREYDPAQDKWSDLPTMPTARSRAAAVLHQGKVFVIGGIEGSDQQPKNSAKVEVYDLRTKLWTRVAPLATPRHGLVAASVGGKIVVAGGYAGEKQMEQSASVEVWDGAAWRKGADMPEPRGFAQAVPFGDALWVFGNRGGANHPLRYDPAQDKWAPIQVEDTTRHRGAAVELGGRLYLLFGEDGIGGPVAVFDFERKAWVGEAR